MTDIKFPGVLLKSEIKRLAMDPSVEMIKPFSEEKIEPASYDVSIGERYWLPGEDIRTLRKNEKLEIPPGGMALIESLERLHLPSNVVGDSRPRRGLALRLVELADAGAQIDPGYEGPIISAIHNAASEPVTLFYGEHFVTIEFRYTTEVTPEDIPYAGEYQRKTLEDVIKKIGPNYSDYTTGINGRVEELTKSLESLVEKQNTMIQDLNTLKLELRGEVTTKISEIEGVLSTRIAAAQTQVTQAGYDLQSQVHRQLANTVVYLVFILAIIIAATVTAIFFKP